jgi:hypothetical protein
MWQRVDLRCARLPRTNSYHCASVLLVWRDIDVSLFSVAVRKGLRLLPPWGPLVDVNFLLQHDLSFSEAPASLDPIGVLVVVEVIVATLATLKGHLGAGDEWESGHCYFFPK